MKSKSFGLDKIKEAILANIGGKKETQENELIEEAGILNLQDSDAEDSQSQEQVVESGAIATPADINSDINSQGAESNLPTDNSPLNQDDVSAMFDNDDSALPPAPDATDSHTPERFDTLPAGNSEGFDSNPLPSNLSSEAEPQAAETQENPDNNIAQDLSGQEQMAEAVIESPQAHQENIPSEAEQEQMAEAVIESPQAHQENIPSEAEKEQETQSVASVDASVDESVDESPQAPLPQAPPPPSELASANLSAAQVLQKPYTAPKPEKSLDKDPFQVPSDLKAQDTTKEVNKEFEEQLGSLIKAIVQEFIQNEMPKQLDDFIEKRLKNMNFKI